MKATILGLKTVTCLAIAFSTFGCNTATSGGGSGSTSDPLDEFQLGADAELDADVAAISAADNEGAACAGLNVTFDDEEVLGSLKNGYPSTEPAEEFPAFVAETAQLEQAKVDEICETTLETASAELLAVLERMTTAGNQNNECIGQAQDITDEGSLATLKREYFGTSAHVYGSMLEFGEELAAAIEETVAETCE